MKRVVVGIIGVATIACAICLRAQQEAKMSSGAHLGCWQLTSFKYGANQPSLAEFPPAQRRIKLITPTHFTWVQFDTSTKKINGTAGGAYSLTGDIYTESIDFADAGMAAYLGSKHAFTIRVEGDKFFLAGSLADGLKIEEVWQRVR